jgi:hypothetical protein
MKLHNMLASGLGILFLLPGCGGNIVDWADETFYQGKMHNDYEKAVKPFLKGVRLYDQFDTLAIFDAIWLSDTVRTAYAQVYAKMIGMDEDGYIDFLRRELSANAYFVSFYVLSQKSIPLTDIPPLWVVHLEIDGKKYLPAEIKAVELAAEYLGFFGKRVNNHKEPYEIRFDRKDAEGVDILEGKREIKLFFSSPRHYGVMSWQIDEDGKVILPLSALIEEEKKEEVAPVVTESKKIARKNREMVHDPKKVLSQKDAVTVGVTASDASQSVQVSIKEEIKKEPTAYDIEGSVPVEDAIESATGSLGEFGGGGGGGFVDGIE